MKIFEKKGNSVRIVIILNIAEPEGTKIGANQIFCLHILKSIVSSPTTKPPSPTKEIKKGKSKYSHEFSRQFVIRLEVSLIDDSCD